MTLHEYIFQIYALLAVASGMMVITVKNPVHSVLWLILVFINASCTLIVLDTEFLALAFIIIYVGAIAVLFLFVIMMLNIKITIYNARIVQYIPFALLFALLVSLEVYMIINQQLSGIDGYITTKRIFRIHPPMVQWIRTFNTNTTIEAIGNVLYTYYYDIFIISGIILLVAMNAAIALTLYKGNFLRKQIAYKQVLRIGNLNTFK